MGWSRWDIGCCCGGGGDPDCADCIVNTDPETELQAVITDTYRFINLLLDPPEFVTAAHPWDGDPLSIDDFNTTVSMLDYDDPCQRIAEFANSGESWWCEIRFEFTEMNPTNWVTQLQVYQYYGTYPTAGAWYLTVFEKTITLPGGFSTPDDCADLFPITFDSGDAISDAMTGAAVGTAPVYARDGTYVISIV